MPRSIRVIAAILAATAPQALAGCDDAAEANNNAYGAYAQGGYAQGGTAPTPAGAMVGPSGAAPGAPGQGGSHTIMDNGQPAADLMVPASWKAESAVRRDGVNGQCSMGIVSPMYRLTSPDGREGIEMFPGFIVTTNEQDIRRRGSQPGDFCIIAMVDSGEALAQQIAVPFLRPQARLQGIRQVALAPEVQSLVQRIQAAGPMQGMRLNPYTVEATVEHGDGTIEKITLGGLASAGQQMFPGVPPLVLNQNLVAYAVRAPADRMAQTEALAAQVRASFRYRPEWKQQVDEFTNRLTKPVFANNGGNRGGGGGYAGGGGNTGGGFDMGAWREGQRQDDVRQEDRINQIREEQRCTLADGTVVTVSIHNGCPTQ